MNKRLENIYNNNFNFTNSLILKRRKQNQVLGLLSIALLFIFAYLLGNTFRNNTNTKLEIEPIKLDNKNKSDFLDRFSFNNSITFQKYFSFSFVNFDTKVITINNDYEQMSFNFFNLIKNSFLTEFCFERDALITKVQISSNIDYKFRFIPYIEENLFFLILSDSNTRVICFCDYSNNIAVKLQKIIDSNESNYIFDFVEILIEHNINQYNLPIKLYNETTSDQKIKPIETSAIIKSKLKKLENLIFFTCLQKRISYDLEIYFSFYFYKKAHYKSFDIELLNSEINKSTGISNALPYLCLKNENKFGIISKKIPQCIEFVNINPKNLYEENLINEIDIFIYDLKSKSLNLYFLNKVIISKENSISDSSEDKIFPFSIFYKNIGEEKGNLRICDFISAPDVLDKKIKIRGIYLEWNTINDSSQYSKSTSKVCFDQLLSIDR